MASLTGAIDWIHRTRVPLWLPVVGLGIGLLIGAGPVDERWERVDEIAPHVVPVPEPNIAFPHISRLGPLNCAEPVCEAELAGWRWAAAEHKARRPADCPWTGEQAFFDGCSLYLDMTGRQDRTG